jgi:transposase
MDRLELFETANLTNRQKQAFELIKLKGHNLKEAAEIMGLSRSTIYYHLKRATEKIKRLEAEKEYQDRIRKLEERISRLEQDFLKHVFEDHIIERFLRG